MIRPGVVLGIARSEARLTRRLVRFWVFQSLAFLIGLVAVAYYLFLHIFFSTWSATGAMINPRYLVGFLSLYFVLVFLVGLIFIGFDIRARDRRERIFEVVDTLPCSNDELLFGRFLGVLLVGWVPVLLISIVYWVVGLAFGSPMQPHSLLSFMFAMAIPAYAFGLGLTFFVTLLVRHRLIAALVLIGVVVGLGMVAVNWIPIAWLPIADVTGAFHVATPSDMIPSILDARGAIQRLGFLLMGLGFVVLAAAIHPRKDDTSPLLRAGVGGGLFVTGAALCLFLVWQVYHALEIKAAWRAAHEARASDPAPDLLSVSGEVRLDPGSAIHEDLTLRFRAPADRPLEHALFSLNPGMTVEGVRSSEGGPREFEHHDGLLEVSLPQRLEPGQETSLQMTISGVPNDSFAYLDAVFDPLALSLRDGNLFLLGFEPFLFRSRFVALLPGARWLPAAGVEVGRGDPSIRPTDFYTVELTLDAPDDWLAAGPGRRTPITEGVTQGRKRWRFAPPAPVPDVAFVAGPFVSRSTEIDGVELEILLHDKHTKNLEVLEPAAKEIRDWLVEHLDEAAQLGLRYPYDALTVVEVPSLLRGYGGGWRMESTLIQPTMVLMRENAFPTARFDWWFSDADKFRDQEGGLPRAIRERLQTFFATDFSGGNPFVGASRSFFGNVTAASGPAGVPLDFVNDELASRLVTGKRGYFSVHHYGRGFGAAMGPASQAAMTWSQQGGDLAEQIIKAVSARPEVWDTVLGVSLLDMHPREEPKRAVDVLAVKGGEMARSLLDGLGRAKAAELLGTLRAEHLGTTYDRQDVLDTGTRIGEDLERWLDVWLTSTELPGFTVGDVGLERLEDAADGAPRYQLRVTVRNEEPTPGLVRLEYRIGSGDEGEEGEKEESEKGWTEPTRLEGNTAIEFGVVTSKPPTRVEVDPYLALNRDTFQIDLPAVDEQNTVRAEPFEGVRAIDLPVEAGSTIVIDDLDPRFSVVDTPSRGWFRFGARAAKDEVTDGGLPVAIDASPPARWSRRARADAWGKYRHTYAVVEGGDGRKQARFAADIPRAGRWRLELHLPDSLVENEHLRKRLAPWNLVIDDGSDRTEVAFDPTAGSAGWNELGIYDLPSQEVVVELTDKTTGRVVVADAVRWTPGGDLARSENP